MNECLVNGERAIIAHNESPEIAPPGDAAFHDLALLVASQHAPVLGRRAVPVETVRSNQRDAATPQPFPQPIGPPSDALRFRDPRK